MNKEELKEVIKEIKRELDIKLYTPIRYFEGNPKRYKSKREVKKRIKEMYERIQKAKRNPKNKRLLNQYETDKGMKTKKSRWTVAFYKKYGEKMEKYKKKPHIERVSKSTGIPENILKEVFDRGVAAHKTGHRPGATAKQWGIARMYSFIMRYKTKSLSHDKDLAKKII